MLQHWIANKKTHQRKPVQNTNAIDKFEYDVPVTSSPYEAEVHFTKACNLKCKHCFYSAGKKLQHQLKKQDWLRFIEDLESNKVLRLILALSSSEGDSRAWVMPHYHERYLAVVHVIAEKGQRCS